MSYLSIATRLLVFVLITAIVVGTINYLAAPNKDYQTKISTIPTNQLSTLPKQTISTDDHALGIAGGSSLSSLSPNALASRIQAIAATGATWIRFDFDWSLIQPNNAQSYQWSAYDNIVADSDHDHLHILGILDYTPAWARPPSCTSSSKCYPASPAQFADFAATVANRYKTVQNWEVWNEPNNPNFWQPAPNPSAYERLLQATYEALHSQDSQAYVITGGLAPEQTANNSISPTDFLTDLYSVGAGNYFDGVGDHPYTFPLTPTSDSNDAWTQMYGNSDSLREIMITHGDANKKIWITEFGSPTGGPGPVATLNQPDLSADPFVVSESLQAAELSDALSLYRTYSWAGPIFYYTYQDAGTNQNTNENFFGLVTANGSQKPAYSVFYNASKTID